MDLRGAERGDEPASLRDTARGKPSGERGGATWAALSGGGDHGAVHVVCSAERPGRQPAHGSASRATAAVSAAVAGAGGDRVRVLGRRWAGRVRQAAAGWAATPLRRGDYAGVLPGHVSLAATKSCSSDWAGRYAVPLALVEPFLLLALFAAPGVWLALRTRQGKRRSEER